jgi:ketosteroid isomerase-like protein
MRTRERGNERPRTDGIMRTTLLLTLCFLAALPAAAQNSEDDAEAVKATLVAMWDAIEQADLERYASYIHPDFTAFGEADVYLAAGRELELRSIDDYLERASNVHTEMHHPQVTIVGDVAWITYYWTDWGVVNGERFTSRGKSTRIFVREEDRWLCIHGHYTAVP